MSSTGAIAVLATITDAGGTLQERMDLLGSISAVLGTNGQRQPITLSSGFNAISVPTGANAVVIRVVSGAFVLTLKGVTGDQGIAIQASTLTTIPIVLPLGTTPSLGITSTGTVVLDVMFL